MQEGFEPFSVGATVGDRYRVTGLCSNSGGMGAILYVDPLRHAPTRPLVLKYCRDATAELRSRFVREVRLLLEFEGNPRVVEIIDHDLAGDPPWFVMPYYTRGDLTGLEIRRDEDLQERVFLEMVDCVAELHQRGVYHRDIKPQNFLVDESGLRISDLGLSIEADSSSGLTRSSVFWGTHGYLPPEYSEVGGFKSPSAASDIFMVGKTIYSLVTGRRDPTYLVRDAIPDPLFFVIERCCETDPGRRIQTTAELKQRIVSAYDVILNRQDNFSAAQQLLQRLREDVSRYQKFDMSEARQFIGRLLTSPETERKIIFLELRATDFHIFGFRALSDLHVGLVSAYTDFVDSGQYTWAFAETVVECMRVFVTSRDIDVRVRAEAFRVAVRAAHLQNRFAAMDACTALLKQVTEEDLAVRLADVIESELNTFIAGVPWSECSSGIIRRKLQELQERR